MKVKIQNLKRFFGKTKAVDDISFEFGSGEIFGFIGPNGAGKTTTIKIMATIEEADEGNVLFDGVSSVEEPEKTRWIFGYMPDSLPEHADIKVWEYLDFFARSYGLKGSARRSRLRELEAFAGLSSMLEKNLKALSKGMKQRVSLARALVHDPPALLMDEPAAGLDPRVRLELRELLKILAGQGKAILISSHILSELEDICTGAVIIEKGAILGAGSIERLSDDVNAKADTLTVLTRFLGDSDKTLTLALQTPFVENAKLTGGNRMALEIAGGDEIAARCLAALIESGCEIIEFTPQSVGLEELFMKITNGDLQ
ncbi:MAG: ABC transporter ATP-binding protein [Victivallales bacterium]|nr:ABC transporter ATP-binding protein [Victivallales bacterium]